MKKNKAAIDANAGFEFETSHGGGFAPSWKPENADEFILIVPTHVIRSLPKKKGMKKAGNVIEVIYKGGNSDNFYKGSGKKAEQCQVKPNETIAIMLSHNLMDEQSIAVEEGKGVRLSKLSSLIIEQGLVMKILFGGKIPTGGGRSVNQYITQAPKGIKELVYKDPRMPKSYVGNKPLKLKK